MLLLFCSSPALAQGIATFSYQRGTIQIERANPPALPALPWQSAETIVPTPAPPKEISVDIRASSALYQQEGWMNLQELSPHHGILFIFDQPQLVTVKPLSIYAPLDVLWVNAEGIITSLAPNIVLANITDPIVSTETSKAVLLLAGGLCAQEKIAPGDRIVQPDFFVIPPPVLHLSK